MTQNMEKFVWHFCKMFDNFCKSFLRCIQGFVYISYVFARLYCPLLHKVYAKMTQFQELANAMQGGRFYDYIVITVYIYVCTVMFMMQSVCNVIHTVLYLQLSCLNRGHTLVWPCSDSASQMFAFSDFNVYFTMCIQSVMVLVWFHSIPSHLCFILL